MTFDELLAQVLALLQRERRVSYRALKRRYDLDDEYLEDLKAEIIQAKKLAIDEEGAVLVWTGEPMTAPVPVRPVVQLPDTQGDQTTQVGPPVAAHGSPEAERRQLTVMFCDLADSTTLSGQLDPEDLRDVIRAYQATSAAVIQRFDGYIAQYLGDGLLVYFGFPQAHEDDAQRAVRTGLGIVEAMETLNMRLEREKGIQLTVRLGIHTGPVVVGEMGGGGRREHLALGETPNIAARIEGLAVATRVVISDRTRQLVGGAFDLDDLGVHRLKGVTEPMRVYGVHSESAAESRFEAATAISLTPLVGREEEISLVLRRWEQVKAVEGQVVLLAGEWHTWPRIPSTV
jgi:class 3 adenylate cyclase